jgi:aspartyl-tRNA(Asn)/glutamyl-tRNA(Gln) amidotransferase subunit A
MIHDNSTLDPLDKPEDDAQGSESMGSPRCNDAQWSSIQSIAEEVRTGKTTARQQVEKSLALIAEHDEYKAIISVISERALERADKIDADIKTGVTSGESVGRLAGVPFIAKDNLLTFGAETTASSNVLKTFNAPYQATVISKLEAEGAICVAKANLDAFAHGASTENSDFFTTLNPHDKTRVPGGSSGGSAASVALKLAPFSLGTDTGGSIRQPASLCGVVGYKPTYGLVSRHGAVAMASSLDVVGPIASSVEDVSLVLDVIAGRDGLDSTMVERQESYVRLDPLDKPEDDAQDNTLAGKKVGVIKEYMGEGVDAGVREVIEKSIKTLKSQGAEVVEISLPTLKYALAVYYIICPAEVSSNLSRYDGIRFGQNIDITKPINDAYVELRSQNFGAEAKRRIMIGTHVLSSGYYDAYYNKAQTVRTKIINEFNKAFEQVDFLIGPVSPVTAFKIGENSHDPLAMYLLDIMTVSANLVGVPAISIPAGTANNMPVGLQIMAAQHKDRELLEFSARVESAIGSMGPRLREDDGPNSEVLC